MSLREFHDYRIRRLDWRLGERVLRLELQLSDEVREVEFSGVYGWHLDDAAEGCTVFSLKEIVAEAYLAEDERYIQSMQKACYSNVVEAVRHGSARIWRLDSSYGFHGYIIAQDCREIAN